ncbi:TraX family protein [Lachnoclostridium sp. Marseille-P6806]|uniref:TraX family protein n=1 Tax=Lachnoclostridium sp. Marseille-P6806 TaxID=2364793 RepID=UPI001030E607|nr:TraX family protein [Lachnoclostridium sp. Marseille-P6806]
MMVPVENAAACGRFPLPASRPLSRDAVKYIAMLTMTLNHIANIFLAPGSLLFEFFIDIGYFTAITMCFFLVEGSVRTRSPLRYGIRLLLFAMLSEIPYLLALYPDTPLTFPDVLLNLNMLWNLFFCYVCLCLLDRCRSPFLLPLCILPAAGSLLCDWSAFAPLFVLLFRWARGRRNRQLPAWGIALLSFIGVELLGQASIMAFSAALPRALGALSGPALAAVVNLLLYNGKRTKRAQRFSKWFFYLYYPAHLTVLALIHMALAGGR